MPPKGTKTIKKEPGVTAAAEPQKMEAVDTSRSSNNPAGRPVALENKFLNQKVKNTLNGFTTTMETLQSLELPADKTEEAFSKIALKKLGRVCVSSFLMNSLPHGPVFVRFP